MYIHLINHQGRQKPRQGTEKRPKKTTMEKRQWHHIHVTFQSSSGMHSANSVLHLLSGKVKSLLLHLGWKEAARKKYAVRAAGIFHKIYSRKRNLFSGRSEWRQGMFVVVFLRGFYFNVSTFLFTDYKLHIYTTSAILLQNLISFGWQFADNWMGVQFKHAIHSGCPI